MLRKHTVCLLYTSQSKLKTYFADYGRRTATVLVGGLLGYGLFARPVSYTHLDVYKRQEARLAQQGLKLADFMKYTGQDEKSFRNQYRDQAEKSVRANLVLEAVENVEKFEATEEEIDAEIEKFAKQIGQNVEDLKKNLTEGDREYFKADVIRDKAVKFLCDNAKAE